MRRFNAVEESASIEETISNYSEYLIRQNFPFDLMLKTLPESNFTGLNMRCLWKDLVLYKKQNPLLERDLLFLCPVAERLRTRY